MVEQRPSQDNQGKETGANKPKRRIFRQLFSAIRRDTPAFNVQSPPLSPDANSKDQLKAAFTRNTPAFSSEKQDPLQVAHDKLVRDLADHLDIEAGLRNVFKRAQDTE